MRFMMLMIPEVYQGANGMAVKADFTPGGRRRRPDEALIIS
jgi:hypothetical protein